MMKKQNLGKVAIALALSLTTAAPFYSANAAVSTGVTTVSATVAETISVACGATLALGTITAGTPLTTSTTCTTTTNANGGYDLAVKRDDATSTIDHSLDAAADIADKTAWNPATPNGALWTGTGLGFRVVQTGTTAALYNSTFWGIDDLAANAKFAGFPGAYANVASSAAYSSTPTAVVVAAKLDVPGTQKSGAYNGTITFQATSKP